MQQKQYMAIDLKSFFASVECVERGLDPLDTNLVVADLSRTEKTICLAVSPSLKAYGIGGRARLYEVVQRVKEVNSVRKKHCGQFSGKSHSAMELADNSLELDYIVAPPRMAKYIKYSTDVYNIYLKYIAPEDIHVYSIDEVFIDATAYLKLYKMSARSLAQTIINDVLKTTGITATAGIGTNLYLCKVALDIVSKKIAPDENGVRIAELDEASYRRQLWSHTPITDFWRVGRGYAKKLEAMGIYTMGDIARCSVGNSVYYNEDVLYKQFGINAELLIDHAWGFEPCTLADIKAYTPENNSLSSGQVLHCGEKYETTALIVKEMAQSLSLELADKNLVTNQIVLTVGYDISNLSNKGINYTGETMADPYGRKVPKHAHGTINLTEYTCSAREITAAATRLFYRIINPKLLARRINITANHVIPENKIPPKAPKQFDLFDTSQNQIIAEETQIKDREKEKNMQKAIISMKKKYGSNAVIKGTNLQDGATGMERNRQIGGHKA